MKKENKTIYELIFKRPLDIIMSFLFIILLSPLLIVLAIIVKIKHKTTFYKEERIGKNNKSFKIFKFNIRKNNEITKFGSKLKRSSLDELPQLFNIFVGNMSFIGPRPKVYDDVKFMDYYNNNRHIVRPGLSGLSQVNGRNELSWDKELQFDLMYIEKVTFIKDFKIFFKTISVLITKKGASSNNNTPISYGNYLLKNNKITEEQYNKINKKDRNY